jgi:methyl-accepting chemotaxis protein
VQRDQAQAAKRINDDSLADYRLACWMLLAITVFATLTGAFVTVLLTRSITRPIGRAVSVAEAVAAGDLSRRLRSRKATRHLSKKQPLRRRRSGAGAQELAQSVAFFRLAKNEEAMQEAA